MSSKKTSFSSNRAFWCEVLNQVCLIVRMYWKSLVIILLVLYKKIWLICVMSILLSNRRKKRLKPNVKYVISQHTHRNNLSIQFLLVESPCMLDVIFLNVGIVFLVHLPIRMPIANLQNERNGGVSNADVTFQLQ